MLYNTQHGQSYLPRAAGAAGFVIQPMGSTPDTTNQSPEVLFNLVVSFIYCVKSDVVLQRDVDDALTDITNQSSAVYNHLMD